ncbi:MAG: type II secretion system protein [Planctomycetota bacterium]
MKMLRNPSAFTLLEVVLSMVLVAGLLVSCMTAISRYQTTLAKAQWQARADAICDQLMTMWHASDDGLPLVTSGRVAADPNFWFRTRMVESRRLCGVPVAVMRLEIIHESALRSSRGQNEYLDAIAMSGVTYVRALPLNSIAAR